MRKIPNHTKLLSLKVSYISRETGVSLIELLVAMAMGLALLSVVLSAFVSMTSGNRLSNAQQQMNEDAQSAFQILAPQIRMAGFNPLQARISTPERNTLSVSAIPATEVVLGIFGCQTGFANGAVLATPPTTAAAEIWQLTCNGAGTMPSLAVHYEADQFSPNITAASVPADCRGFAVPARTQNLTNPDGSAGGTANYYLVENRYFIVNGSLYCAGNGGAIPFETPTQPIVANIETMQLTYGVRAPQPFATVAGDPTTWTPAQIANNDANETAARVAAGYLTADQIGLPSGNTTTGVHAGFTTASVLAVNPNLVFGSQRWALVNTVRVCLVVKSTTATLIDQIGEIPATPAGPGTPAVPASSIYGYYSGCNPSDNTQINITDGFMRKAYVMHFSIRSRVNTPK
jgi:Tfp pilus assembly protein PilW